MVVLIGAIVAFQLAHAASWLTILFAILVVLDVALLFVAYFYFMRQRPHSLRSESFDYRITELIQKRAGAMEAGLFVEYEGAAELKRRGSSQEVQRQDGDDE